MSIVKLNPRYCRGAQSLAVNSFRVERRPCCVDILRMAHQYTVYIQAPVETQRGVFSCIQVAALDWPRVQYHKGHNARQSRSREWGFVIIRFLNVFTLEPILPC